MSWNSNKEKQNCYTAEGQSLHAIYKVTSHQPVQCKHKATKRPFPVKKIKLVITPFK